MSRLYYTPPPDDAFDDMKMACLAVWSQYDDEYGYHSDKVARIEHIKNVQDNFMYMLAMFDHINQAKVVSKLKPATRKEVRERLLDGGNPPHYLDLIGL